MDIAFSPDGEIVASASSDNTLKLWNLEGKLIKNLKNVDDIPLTSVSFLDNKTLICRTTGYPSKAYSSKRKWKTEPYYGTPYHLNVQLYDLLTERWSYSRNTQSDIYQGRESKASWYNDVDYPVDISLLDSSISKVNCFAASRDGQKVASAHKDGTIVIWRKSHINTLSERQTLTGHTHPVLKVVFSSDNNTIVSYSYDNTIKLWQVYGKFESYYVFPHPLRCDLMPQLGFFWKKK